MILVLGAIILLFALYLFLLAGRTGHKKLDSLRCWRYAHRGLHAPGAPENSMAAFRRALDGGYGIELDVHLMKDGALAVIHDESLKRTAGAEVNIEDLTEAELANYSLEGTREQIPTLPQVLSLFAGKAPMIVELKTAGGNHAPLCDGVMALLSEYPGPYCIESFDPRCIAYLKKHYPQVIRGQLSFNYLRSAKEKFPWIARFAMTYLLPNVFTRPDFIAYRFADRKNLSMQLCCKVLGLQGVSWTLRAPEDLAAAEKEGMLPIFEKFIP